MEFFSFSAFTVLIVLYRKYKYKSEKERNNQNHIYANKGPSFSFFQEYLSKSKSNSLEKNNSKLDSPMPISITNLEVNQEITK